MASPSSNKQSKQSKPTGVEARCPKCGMPRDEWPDPQGFTEGGRTYCCEGCADGSGCTCG